MHLSDAIDISSASKVYYQTSLLDSFPQYLELKLGKQKIKFKKKTWNFADETLGLRYGTNPSQAGAFYIPESTGSTPLNWNFLKNGKGGPSATNIEDLSQAIEILKYFEPNRPASVIMKHLIPSGFCVLSEEETLAKAYEESRNLDYLSSFGGVVVLNNTLDLETAKKISESFIEVIAAPDIDQEVVDFFNKLPNKSQVRIVELGDFHNLPKYKGDNIDSKNINLKVLVDGSIIIERPFLSQITSIKDLYFNAYVYESGVKHQAQLKPDEGVLQDLYDSYHVLQGVRSNAAVIMKQGRAVCGSGETKRVDAVVRATEKVKEYITGKNIPKGNSIMNDWTGAVASTDGFPPFDDTISELQKIGVKHVLFPPGGKNSWQIIEKANSLGMSIAFTPYNARCFTHR